MGFKGAGGYARPSASGGGGGKGEEDRTRDWYCSACSERNFVKRMECFKCKLPRPKDGGLTAPPKPLAPAPKPGATLNGMVKSYNRRGFGFLMSLGVENCQDIYYTRDSLSPKLQTRDIAGQHVTFEIQREPNGKISAVNIRPLGEERDQFEPPVSRGKGLGKPSAPPRPSGRDDEDRSRDWICEKCKERNFVKRFECFKCGSSRSGFSGAAGIASAGPADHRRTLSPHAGSRAMRSTLLGAAAGPRASSASRSRSGRRRSSSSSSSSSQRKSKKKKKKQKKKKRNDSSDSSRESSCSSSSCSRSTEEEPANTSGSGPKAQEASNPEVEQAKSEALEQLMQLRSVEPKETRMKEWRALLRKWHPDKNPERTEVATAVFQFLQKGKPVLEGSAR